MCASILRVNERETWTCENWTCEAVLSQFVAITAILKNCFHFQFKRCCFSSILTNLHRRDSTAHCFKFNFINTVDNNQPTTAAVVWNMALSMTCTHTHTHKLLFTLYSLYVVENFQVKIYKKANELTHTCPDVGFQQFNNHWGTIFHFFHDFSSSIRSQS